MGFRLVSGLQGQPTAFWVSLAIKTLLICLLAFGAFSGLQQFEGKAFIWRWPPIQLPPLWSRVRSGQFAREIQTYPYAADILLALPFLIDTAGNAVDFYDAIWWWDDVNHLVNWALLSGAVGA